MGEPIKKTVSSQTSKTVSIVETVDTVLTVKTLKTDTTPTTDSTIETVETVETIQTDSFASDPSDPSDSSDSSDLKDSTDEDEVEDYTQKKLSFDDMNLKEDLLRGIFSYGFDKPSEIQQLAITPIIMKRDIIAQARSGTGKTATFGIGILQRIDFGLSKPQALILAPTRELVEQITLVIKNLGEYLKVKVEGFVGGKSLKEDIKKLKDSVQVVVGTPGRIEDLISKNLLELKYLKIFVLDEADEMLSKGFIEQVHKIFVRLKDSVQTALFSATLTEEVKTLINRLMKNPIKIYIPLNEQTLDGIPQYFIKLSDRQKIPIIKELYANLTLGTTIIFCNSIKSVDILSEELISNDFAVSSIHGDMTQVEREEKLKSLRKGSTRLLITTDILSRGIDVQQLSMVINYDIPYEPETYIHRIGRCGRYGRKGIAVNFVNSKDQDRIKFIESHYRTKINEIPISNIDEFIK